jgi:enterochelin esterase-like enzyme
MFRSGNGRIGKRSGVAAAAGLCVLASSFITHAALAAGPQGASADGPVIKHTAAPPTGYTVTFRLRAPNAKRVQIRGEWFFERPSELSSIASTADHTVETPGRLPVEWQPGDVPIGHPNSTAGNWPVIEMTKGPGGLWTYTTPLPSGVFSYGFFVDCQDPKQQGCTQISDPANRPWNDQNGVVDGSVEPMSQVYVPSDPVFHTVDYSWQAPAAKRGQLTHVTYSSPGHTNPADKNYVVVYTPPGYDARRATPYSTLYLNHGGGGNEMDWSTQGALGNILDNLIGVGAIRPILVVMPNANGYPASTNNEAFRNDLIRNIVPYVEQHYRVSTSASDRAFSGLSAGGLITNQLMLYNTSAFGYYGMMSAGFPPDTKFTDEQAAALKRVSIFVGSGWQDPIHAAGFVNNGRTMHTGPLREVGTFVSAGIPVTVNFVNGGHEWYVWRILLRDLLTRAAFLPPVATLP